MYIKPISQYPSAEYSKDSANIFLDKPYSMRSNMNTIQSDYLYSLNSQHLDVKGKDIHVKSKEGLDQLIANWDGQPIKGGKIHLASHIEDSFHQTGGRSGDRKAIIRLLEGSHRAADLTPIQRKTLAQRIVQGGLDAAHVYDTASDVARKAKKEGLSPSAAVDKYLTRIGAMEYSEADKARGRSLKVKQDEMLGLDNKNDLSLFSEYKATAINKSTGKREVVLEMGRKEVAMAGSPPGILAGSENIDWSKYKKGSLEVDGKLQDANVGTKNRSVSVNSKDLNNIANKKAKFTDFIKYSFFERIGKGIKSFFGGVWKGIKGIGKAALNFISAPFKGVSNFVGSLIKGEDLGTAFKNGLQSYTGSISNGAKNIVTGANGFTEGVASLGGNISGAFADAFFGDKTANKVTEKVEGGINWVSDHTIDATAESFEQYTGGIDKVANGNNSGWVDIGIGGVTFAATFAAGGVGGIAKAGAKGVSKKLGGKVLRSSTDDLAKVGGSSAKTFSVSNVPTNYAKKLGIAAVTDSVEYFSFSDSKVDKNFPS